MKNKKWLLREKVSVLEKEKFPEVNPIVLQLLFDRGLRTQMQIEEFLTPDYLQDIHDPFILLQMKEACTKIFEAIDSRELIMIFGDYDCDGVCGSLILQKALKALGARVKVYLPHREKEGYGLSKTALDYIQKQDTKLLITVDCGISNKDDIIHAQNLGIEVIVTDHHEPNFKALPPCLIIHPRGKDEIYPYKFLSGGGVAFKLVQGLLKIEVSQRKKYPKMDWITFEKWLLDLVAISTVGDMMPILGENRTLVKYGLVVLNKVKRLGLENLLKQSGLLIENSNLPLKLTTDNISFQIVPRINAAGRLEHANNAFELLESEDQIESEKLARDLENNNKKRQKITEQIFSEAKDQIKEQIGEISEKEARVLFVFNSSWPAGILGLVASQLLAEYYLPIVVATENDGKIVASIRSISGFNVVEGMEFAKEYLEKFGGHAAAAGFTLKAKKDWDLFKEKFNNFFINHISEEELLPKVEIDLEIPFSGVNWDLYENLTKMEPFGKDNNRPVFLTRNLIVSVLESVGSEKQHLKISLFDGINITRKAIGFCLGSFCNRMTIGSKVDVVYEVEVNEWNGNRELQLRIIDLKINII